MLSRRRFIAISAAAAAFAGTGRRASAGPVSWNGTALGAHARLVIAGLPEAEAQRLISMARSEIERLEDIFSLYRAGSTLTVLNTHGRLDAPPPDLLALMGLCTTIHHATDGTFDPTIQPLWMAFADHAGAPPASVLTDTLQRIGWSGVHYDTGAVRFRQRGMQMSFNGIAQGFITDRIVALLRAHGLKDAVVSLGEIAALGQRAPGAPWTVGIADRSDGKPDMFVDLKDRAIATSSPAGLVFGGEGGVGHILDPQRGVPDQKWTRVSVIHRSAAISDGLSTAFSVMPREAMEGAMKHFPDIEVIALDHDRQTIRIGTRPAG